MLSQILERELGDALDLIENALRDQHLTWLCDTFNACGYVNAIAKKIVLFYDYIGQVDSDTKFKFVTMAFQVITQATLDFEADLNCRYRARKLRQETISCPCENAATTTFHLFVH